MRRPTARPVAVQNMDIAVAKIGQRRGGLLGQRAMTLDGVDIGSNFGKDCRRVARTGTDFEDLLAAAKHQCLGHKCDDIGLRNCLALFNRQGRVFISKLAKPLRQKAFARNAAHGIENKLGANTPRVNGRFNHLPAQS